MGEEEVGLAEGAVRKHIDLGGMAEGAVHIGDEGELEIDEAFAAGGRGLADDGRARTEAVTERREDFRADLKRTGTDAGADGDVQISSGVMINHLDDGAVQNAGDGAAPTGVHRGDGATIARSDEDGAAISDADANHARPIGADEGISLGVVRAVVRPSARPDGVNGGTVDLVNFDKRAGGAVEGGEDAGEVGGDVGGRVALLGGQIAGVAEVEGGENTRRNTALAGGEGVGNVDGGEQRRREEHRRSRPEWAGKRPDLRRKPLQGFEPWTYALRKHRSTAELKWR